MNKRLGSGSFPVPSLGYVKFFLHREDYRVLHSNLLFLIILYLIFGNYSALTTPLKNFLPFLSLPANTPARLPLKPRRRETNGITGRTPFIVVDTYFSNRRFVKETILMTRLPVEVKVFIIANSFYSWQ